LSQLNAADQQIVGSRVAALVGLLGHRPGFFDDHFMGMQEPRDLRGKRFAARNAPAPGIN
jgi:hypothetical protein